MTAKKAKVAQLVEHDLPKVGVAGSNPVFRSNVWFKRLTRINPFWMKQIAALPSFGRARKHRF